VLPHLPSAGRRAACALSLTLSLCAAARVGSGQEQVGPARCFSCHASLAKASWEQKHRGSAKQLDEPKAAAFAAGTAGGTRAPRCLACHAPTTAGSEKGVSCETCHGPGSLYRVPHQQPAFYQKPDGEWQGLVNLYGNPERIARTCVGCHVLDPDKDAAIAAAGHPTGANYAALGKKLDEMKHWPSNDPDALLSRRRSYDAAFLGRVTSAAAGPVAARLARLPKSAAPAAAKTAQSVAPSSGPPVRTAPADDPFFADEVPEYVPGTIDTRPPKRVIRTIAPEPPPAAITPAPLAQPEPPPAPSTAAATLSARMPPQDVAELRGRAVRAARQLLKEGAVARGLPPPRPQAGWPGPDGELLRLQDEALALALEAMRAP
jgi:hypothetical protein